MDNGRTARVTPADTAAAWGDFPAAASTPFLLGLAELACHALVADDLEEGEVTVGAGASIDHLLPSPVGATVTAWATVLEGTGRRFRFAVDIVEGGDVVARVQHARAVVRREAIDRTLAERRAATQDPSAGSRA